MFCRKFLHWCFGLEFCNNFTILIFRWGIISITSDLPPFLSTPSISSWFAKSIHAAYLTEMADFNKLKEINSKSSKMNMILVGKRRGRGGLEGRRHLQCWKKGGEFISEAQIGLTSGLLMFQCGRVPLPLAACPRLRGEVDGRAGEEDGGRATRGRPQPHQQTQENIL